MNNVRSRVKIVTAEDIARVDQINKINGESSIREIYNTYKDHPKVKWKESIKKVVGLRLAERAGEDK